MTSEALYYTILYYTILLANAVKKLRRIQKLLKKLHLRATGHHLPCGITQCYLLPDTSEYTPP